MHIAQSSAANGSFWLPHLRAHFLHPQHSIKHIDPAISRRKATRIPARPRVIYRGTMTIGRFAPCKPVFTVKGAQSENL